MNLIIYFWTFYQIPIITINNAICTARYIMYKENIHPQPRKQYHGHGTYDTWRQLAVVIFAYLLKSSHVVKVTGFMSSCKYVSNTTLDKRGHHIWRVKGWIQQSRIWTVNAMERNIRKRQVLKLSWHCQPKTHPPKLFVWSGYLHGIWHTMF